MIEAALYYLMCIVGFWLAAGVLFVSFAMLRAHWISKRWGR